METMRVQNVTPNDLPWKIKYDASRCTLCGSCVAACSFRAIEAKVEGEVLLLIEIDETGAVTYVEVLQGLGHGLDEAAAEAARQFTFSPAEDPSGPVPVAIEFAYGFALEAEPPPEEPVEDGAEEPEPEQLPVNLEGELVEMGTRLPLAEIAVTVTAGEQTFTTTSDAEGRWQLRGVPVGTAAEP